ncbi:MAG: helix-turn-helix transcriptional regulator [Clostridia bacterium]|nr:helix-turn-helix transcriptional regulator [Clostridia bacterium]
MDESEKELLEDFSNQMLWEPGFKEAWEYLQPEIEIAMAAGHALKTMGMTEKQLSKAAGISVPLLRRMCNAEGNPSLAQLKRLANVIGRRLVLKFVPEDEKPEN